MRPGGRLLKRRTGVLISELSWLFSPPWLDCLLLLLLLPPPGLAQFCLFFSVPVTDTHSLSRLCAQ